MTRTQEFLLLFSHTALILVCHCKADQHLPPTGLSYQWLNNFYAGVTWEKPRGLPNDSMIRFFIEGESDKLSKCLPGMFRKCSIPKVLLTEERQSDSWTYTIRTVSECSRPYGETPATITISTLKPRAELVKDFKCTVYSNQVKCSWIPVKPGLNLTISPWIFDRLWKCDDLHSSPEENVCNINTSEVDISNRLDRMFILVETEDLMSTFKPLLVIPPPKQTIREEAHYLYINLTSTAIFKEKTCLIYEVCYKQCNNPKVCQNTSNTESTMKVGYDKNCLYEFQSKVRMIDRCAAPYLFSDFSTTVTHGSNQIPVLTVVSIVIPIMLSISILLSCYCIRRHRNIICPAIPDPSAIFKEMMMSENKELKNAGSLYTPVPVHIDHCRITLLSETPPQDS